MPKLNMQTVRCNHCGKKALMHVEKTVGADIYKESDNREEPDVYSYTLEFLSCSACDWMNIALYDDSDDDPEVIYPPKLTGRKELLGLPSEIDKAYKVAQKVRDIDINLFGVQLGKILELICKDRNAKGNRLVDQIQYLADNNEMPERLAKMAHQLRQLRNFGAHAGSVELTPAEVPILDALCEAILEYLYHAPKLIEQVEERIKNLKTS